VFFLKVGWLSSLSCNLSILQFTCCIIALKSLRYESISLLNTGPQVSKGEFEVGSVIRLPLAVVRATLGLVVSVRVNAPDCEVHSASRVIVRCDVPVKRHNEPKKAVNHQVIKSSLLGSLAQIIVRVILRRLKLTGLQSGDAA
jgi:hypothetical protein